jgi:hypothetical protein
MLTNYDKNSILFFAALYRMMEINKKSMDTLTISTLMCDRAIEDFIDYGETFIHETKDHYKYNPFRTIYYIQKHNYIALYDYVIKSPNNGKTIILVHDECNRTIEFRDFNYEFIKKTCYIDVLHGYKVLND